MAKHHPDLIMCRKTPGIAIGRLCEKCDGKCVICDSYVRPCTLVRVCDECNYGSFQGRCVICGGVGISDAYYCKECTQQEKDRDGCPKIVNLGSAKTDLFYERKKYGFKKRWWGWIQHFVFLSNFCTKCMFCSVIRTLRTCASKLLFDTIVANLSDHRIWMAERKYQLELQLNHCSFFEFFWWHGSCYQCESIIVGVCLVF
jgi:PHD finger-like domain-containing protein 5A